MWRLVRKLFGIKDPTTMPTTRMRVPALEQLWWLADSPLFIDEQLVGGFYDAVVRPQFELQGKTVGKISEETKSLLVGVGAEAQLGLPPFLSLLVPTANLEANLERTSERSRQASQAFEFKAIKTAGRSLEELVAVYVAEDHFRDRLLFMECPTTAITTLNGGRVDLGDFSEGSDTFPRSLVFVEVRPGAAIIPTMCEFAAGGFAPLHELLILRLWSSEPERPQYPSEASPRASNERRAYWNAIADRYQSRAAMEVLENAMTDGKRLEWVDFRLPLNGNGDTLHLHVCPRGQYSAGTFGYNFIRRGNRKGVRIVGSLKKGPDLNVLAIFEC